VFPADIVLPVGSMPADWHSVEDIQAWIDLGYGTAPVGATTPQADAIATAYAYYRGYNAKADTLLGSPDNVGLGDMSVAQSNGRYDRMKSQAAGFYAQWEAAVVAVTYVEPEVVLHTSRTVTIPIYYRWGT
jgi:hypothetical protein